jgi:hypothetical protein
LSVLLVAVLAGCGGGGTTTVIERGAPVAKESAPTSDVSTAKTLINWVGIEHLAVEPPTYSFAADGSLAGIHLKWEGWGTPTATGRGTISERDPEGEGAQDRLTYPGSVVASGIESCNGRNYYTEAVVEVPPDAAYVPTEASQLVTPCRSYAEIEAEAKPEESTGTAERTAPDDARPQFFYTPSHNIGCALSPDGVRCDIRSKTWTGPPKPADCHTDWGNSVSVTASEAGHVLCAGDTLLTGTYGELPYGNVLQRGAITCLSKSNGLTCTNRAGDGFFLSVQELKLY